MFGAVGVMITTMKVIQTDITQTHSKAFHHPLLSPLKTLFRWVQWVVGVVGGGCAGVVDVWSGGCYDYSNESDPDIT